MKNILKISFIFLLITQMLCAHRYHEPKFARAALVCIPVADMLVQSAYTYTSCENPIHIYGKIPFASEYFQFPSVRAHQCLFNEILLDVSLNEHECKGTFPSAWYDFDEKKRIPKNNYYTKQSNIILLDDLKKSGVPLNVIPDPEDNTSKKILTLLIPRYDPQTRKAFSAGTRFVRVPRYDNDHSYAVIFAHRSLINPEEIKTVISTIPKEFCITNADRNTKIANDKRQFFVNILKTWIAHASPDIIPYVFGGSSFIAGYPDQSICPQTQVICGQESSVYLRPSDQKTYTGFDCSELIWRAAQITGINYPYKNTSMIKRFLIPLNTSDRMQRGDLILFPGHVMVASDIKKNLLIESAGYKWGYGKVHEIALSQKFENIKTYDDLLRVFHDQSPVKILSTQENNYYEHQKILLFKLLQ